MSEIANDQDFRKALDGLAIDDQRRIGAAFVESVIDFSSDDRVREAVKAAREGMSAEMQSAVFKSAKKASLDSHARCGADADWSCQADYFVARAASAVVAPPGQMKSDNVAWLAAVHARMAKTCASVDAPEDLADQERQSQYRLLSDFLQSAESA